MGHISIVFIAPDTYQFVLRDNKCHRFRLWRNAMAHLLKRWGRNFSLCGGSFF